MTATDQRPQLRDRVDGVVRSALAVPGVRAVRVEADEDGAALLRLELDPGADEDAVAAAVDAALRRAEQPDQADGADGADGAEAAAAAPQQAAATAPAAVPAAAAVRPAVRVPAPAPAPERGDGPRPRTGRISVPPVSSAAVAATPAPQWLGESAPALAPVAAAVIAPAAPPDPAPAAPAPAPLRLDRVSTTTEGLGTTATVVLVDRGTAHTGVADAASTPSGALRSLATAALRALESAAGGRLRGEVDAVRTVDLDGRASTTVLLSVVTAAGVEHLVGAALEEAGQPAVVRAVLAACERRLPHPTA